MYIAWALTVFARMKRLLKLKTEVGEVESVPKWYPVLFSLFEVEGSSLARHRWRIRSSVRVD